MKGSKFSAAEDQQLLQLVEIHQRKWNIIAESIERTPTHCVNRYFQLRQPGEMKNFSQEDEEKLCSENHFDCHTEKLDS